MTPAELKTLRESLGLPVQWLAERANVQRRSVEYWEAGRSKVPDDVAELMLQIDAQFAEATMCVYNTTHGQRTTRNRRLAESGVKETK